MAKKSRSSSDLVAALWPPRDVDFIIRHNRIEKLIDSLPDQWRSAARALMSWKDDRGVPLPNAPELYIARACLHWVLASGIRRAHTLKALKALKEVDMLLRVHLQPRGRPQKLVTEEERASAQAEYQAIRRAAREAGRPLGADGQQREKRRIAASLDYGKAFVAELFRKQSGKKVARGRIVSIKEINRLRPAVRRRS
jgi:hypothetical protein